MSPILGTLASQFSGKPFSSFESIATVTVGSGGSSNIEFTSIPSTYKHLQLRGIARTPDSSNVFFQFNSDTGSNYNYMNLTGNGSVVENYGAASQNNILFGKSNYSASNSSMFATTICDILEYASTNKNKAIKSLVGTDTNGGAGQSVGVLSGLWRNASAITSIKLFPSSGIFNQYSQFALYGIKGA
jgi:hypothetical protein